MPAEGRASGREDRQKGDRDPRDWREPPSSGNGSETPAGVACESEGSLGLPRGAGAGPRRRPCRQSRRWLSRKHRVKSGKVVRFPDGRPWRIHGRERLRVRTEQLPVGEGMISNQSPVRENRTLGSMSRERNRDQGGDRGTGTRAKAVSNRYSLHPRQARLSSTLLSRIRASRANTGLPLPTGFFCCCREPRLARGGGYCFPKRPCPPVHSAARWTCTALPMP